jgi:hypothetical protein
MSDIAELLLPFEYGSLFVVSTFETKVYSSQLCHLILGNAVCTVHPEICSG